MTTILRNQTGIQNPFFHIIIMFQYLLHITEMADKNMQYMYLCLHVSVHEIVFMYIQVYIHVSVHVIYNLIHDTHTITLIRKSFPRIAGLPKITQGLSIMVYRKSFPRIPGIPWKLKSQLHARFFLHTCFKHVHVECM